MYNLITYSGHTAKETTQLNLLSSGHTAICPKKLEPRTERTNINYNLAMKNLFSAKIYLIDTYTNLNIIM